MSESEEQKRHAAVLLLTTPNRDNDAIAYLVKMAAIGRSDKMTKSEYVGALWLLKNWDNTDFDGNEDPSYLALVEKAKNVLGLSPRTDDLTSRKESKGHEKSVFLFLAIGFVVVALAFSLNCA